jgi:hypothetical protein
LKQILLFLAVFTSSFVIASECPDNKKTFAQWYETDMQFHHYNPSKLILSSDACFIKVGGKKTEVDNAKFSSMIGQGFRDIKNSIDKDAAFEEFIKNLTEHYDVSIDPKRGLSKLTGHTTFTLVIWQTNHSDNNEVTYFIEETLVKLGVNI